MRRLDRGAKWEGTPPLLGLWTQSSFLTDEAADWTRGYLRRHHRGVELGGHPVLGLLVDIDGVLYVGNQVVPGAVEAMQRLQIPHLLLTNTTTRSAASLVTKLQSLGFEVSSRQILTAPLAAKQYLESWGSPPALLLLSEDAKRDFADYPQATSEAKAVVVGDIGPAWSYELLNRIFRMIDGGAELVALHKNRFWQTREGLQLDIGAFVAGLEYASGKPATIIGKPNPAFFAAALARLGVEARDAAMIGDDIETDVGGAQAQGIFGIQVKTGKYRAEHAAASGIIPDLLVDSIAAL